MEEEALVPIEEIRKQFTPVPPPAVAAPKIADLTEKTSFSAAVDAAKIKVLNEAEANDPKFGTEIAQKLKDAAQKLIEVEKEKAELEKQNITYHSELLLTQQKLNEHQQAENKWKNKEASRKFHYDGVAPILESVGIKTPMCLPILYILIAFILPFFLIGKFLKGTVGALISGASDADRPKEVKAFLWTLLAAMCLIVLVAAIYLGLKWFNVI